MVCLLSTHSQYVVFLFVRLYTDLVTDSLAEFSYDADLAGLQYTFASHSLGLWVTLSGYNDKLPVLAHHVLEKIKDIEVDPERLRVMKEQVTFNELSYNGVAYVHCRSREIGITSSLDKRIAFRTISAATS
jgi:secreted Zn-dependent insulinase-like peptidase